MAFGLAKATARRKPMPVLLWLGIPVLLVGSGFVIYRIVGM
jgi:hypothetical protein